MVVLALTILLWCILAKPDPVVEPRPGCFTVGSMRCALSPNSQSGVCVCVLLSVLCVEVACASIAVNCIPVHDARAVSSCPRHEWVFH